MAGELQNLLTWHNGEKTYSPFSQEEMSRRQSKMRRHMEDANLDACLFTSYHNICYFSGFMYCRLVDGSRWFDLRECRNNFAGDRWWATLAA